MYCLYCYNISLLCRSNHNKYSKPFRGSEKKSDDQSVCVAVTGVKVPTVQSGHISITGVKASAVEKTTTPTSNYILSEKESSTKTEQIALEKSPNRNSPLVKSTEASPKTNSSSKKQYTRDVCNSKGKFNANLQVLICLHRRAMT